MLLPLAFLGGVIALAWAALRSSRREPEPSMDPLGPMLPKPPEERTEEIPDPTDDEIMEEVEREGERLTRSSVHSPWPNVSDDKWWRFVQWAMQGTNETVTAAGNLGIFLLSPLILQDLGYLTTSKVMKNNRPFYQVVAWRTPYSQELWSTSPNLQYDAWRKHVIRLADWVKTTAYRNFTTTNVDGKDIPVTLSGLLGLCLMAGPAGMEKWFAGDRKESTTKAFQQTTGIF